MLQLERTSVEPDARRRTAYRSEVIRSRSELALTGRKRDLGTTTECEFLKCLIAAPMAVSSWMTASPLSATLGLTMI